MGWLTFGKQVTPPTPAAGKVSLYVDSTAGTPYYVDDSGVAHSMSGGGGSSGGTVTSVGLTLPSIFSVTGTPVTGAGTLAASWVSQTANTFLSAPDGAAGVPLMRTIVAADIPTLNQSTTGSAATLTTPRTIAGVSFNGSANITIPFANLASPPTTRAGYGITDAAPLVVPASALTTTSGVVAINCSLSQVFTLTTTANVTSITFSNVSATGTAAFVILRIKQGTTPYTIAWPASFKWPGGTAYVVSAVANAVDTVALMTVDGGTTWQAIGNKGFA